MTKTKNIPVMHTFYPPAIANLISGRYAMPGWIPIDDDITLEDLRSKWTQKLPKQEPVVEVKNNVYPVLSSKGDHEYYVEVKNNQFTCTCPGYGFRRQCKHVEMIKKQLNA